MKKLINKVKGWVIILFGGEKKFEDFVFNHVDDAIEICNNISKIINAKSIATLINILPPKYKLIAGSVLDKIQSTIDKVITDLLPAVSTCGSKATFNERLQCFIEYFNSLSPAMQEAAKLKFASRYAMYHSGTIEKKSILDAAVQNRFIEQTEKL